MNKCIILYTANYCAKIKNYFCVDDLISKDVEVEFWDLGLITINEHLADEFSEGLMIRKIRDKKEYIAEVKKNREAVFFSYINYTWYSYFVYRILSKYDCKIVYCTSGALPSVCYGEGHKIPSIFKVKQLYIKLRAISFRLIRDTFLFKPATFVLKSCRYSESDYKVSKNTVYLGINSSDFQGYKLKIQNGIDGKTDERYIVYIDQYLPFHNDYLIAGIKQINPDVFYKSLNKFFDSVEESYNCKVVIAAHPSSLLYKEHNYFEGRDIVFNKTAELVHNSMGVISFTSTAVSFPVIDNKPIIFYTSDEILKEYTRQNAKGFSDLLGCLYINIDHFSDCVFREVDVNKYNSYKYDYLTTPMSENFNNSDIVLSILNDNYSSFKYYEQD